MTTVLQECVKISVQIFVWKQTVQTKNLIFSLRTSFLEKKFQNILSIIRKMNEVNIKKLATGSDYLLLCYTNIIL